MSSSDWSAEVCSSDLDRIGIEHRHHRLHAFRKDAGQPAGRRQGATRAIGESKAFLGSAHDFAHSDQVRRPGKAHTARATAHGFDEAVPRKDRKGVVEGKSVSVRVDRGRGRLIKKKKTTKRNMH